MSVRIVNRRLSHLLVTAAALAAAVASTAAPATATSRKSKAKPKPAHPVANRAYEGMDSDYDNLELVTSTSGTRFNVPATEIGVQCQRNVSLLVSLAAATGRISATGSFRLSLPATQEASASQPVFTDTAPIAAVVISGRFVTSKKASGTLSWDASPQHATGCELHSRWSATVQPLNHYFTGTTSLGQTVTFSVSDSNPMSLFAFSASPVTPTCAPGAVPGESGQVGLVDGDGGTVKANGTFSDQGTDADGIAFSVSGTLVGGGTGSASGTAVLTDPDGCGFSVSWTAAYSHTGP